MHSRTMNDRAELMALRIIEELEVAGAVDVNKILTSCGAGCAA